MAIFVSKISFFTNLVKNKGLKMAVEYSLFLLRSLGKVAMSHKVLAFEIKNEKQIGFNINLVLK